MFSLLAVLITFGMITTLFVLSPMPIYRLLITSCENENNFHTAHYFTSRSPTLHPSTSYKYTSSNKVTQIYVIQQSIPTLQIILLFICSTKQKYNSMRKILNPMSRIAYRVFVFYFLLKWMMQFIT